MIVAIIGATGVLYGVEMLRVLKTLGQETHLILSEAGGDEPGHRDRVHRGRAVRRWRALVYNKDVGAAVASGLFRHARHDRRAVHGEEDAVGHRQLAVRLQPRRACRRRAVKEGRKPQLMARETPSTSGHLELMARAADCGAILLPPMPAFYHRPQSIMDIVHQSIGKALDQVGIEHDLFERWSGRPRRVRVPNCCRRRARRHARGAFAGRRRRPFPPPR
ncbi:MAG: 3-octaprenyl-4-hydroxybenzoate carboxy-lyase [Rubrivivax sp.]